MWTMFNEFQCFSLRNLPILIMRNKDWAESKCRGLAGLPDLGTEFIVQGLPRIPIFEVKE